MQKNCFCRAITLLFDSKSDAFHNKNTAFSASNHPTKKPLFIEKNAEITLTSHKNCFF